MNVFKLADGSYEVRDDAGQLVAALPADATPADMTAALQPPADLPSDQVGGMVEAAADAALQIGATDGVHSREIRPAGLAGFARWGRNLFRRTGRKGG